MDRTFIFHASDGQSFRLLPGTSVIVGRGVGIADIVFSDPKLSRRLCRWVNTGDTCTIECLMNRWWVQINGRPASTFGVTVKAGDTIELVPGLTVIGDVETTGESTGP